MLPRRLALPALHPQPLVRIPEAFNHPAWVWELKPDGFRALAYVEAGECRLVSRNGHTYRSFDPLRRGLASELQVKDAILDGEIACLDAEGRSLFNRLLFRRQAPVYAAFDVGREAAQLRSLPKRGGESRAARRSYRPKRADSGVGRQATREGATQRRLLTMVRSAKAMQRRGDRRARTGGRPADRTRSRELATPLAL